MMIFGTALPKQDLYYYVALTVLLLIIAYVIYTESSSSFSSQSYIEGFGSKDKDKKDKEKEKKSKTGKLVEQMNDQNDSLEESLKISDNKNDYIDLLAAHKRNTSLEVLNTISKGGVKPEQMSIFISVIDGVDKLIEFVESE